MPKRGLEDAEPSDPDEELSQRRERGRIAQRAFRQRQINTIRELREANQAMLDAIDSITSAAVQVGDPNLLRVVQDARRTAGFDDARDLSASASPELRQQQQQHLHHHHHQLHSQPLPSSHGAGVGVNMGVGVPMGSAVGMSLPDSHPMLALPSNHSAHHSDDADADGELDAAFTSMAGLSMGLTTTTTAPTFGFPITALADPLPQHHPQPFAHAPTFPTYSVAGTAPSTPSITFSTTDNSSAHSQASLRLEDVLHTPQLNAPDERRGGRASPRLNYGLWADPERLLNPVGPPPDLLPYLNDPSSLATVLFWFTHFTAYQALRQLVHSTTSSSTSSDSYNANTTGGHPPAANPGVGTHGAPGRGMTVDLEAIATARRMFGHSLTFEPGATILQRIHLRLIYRKLGYVENDHPGNADPDATTRLHMAVVDDLNDKGVRLDEFIQVDAIERLVRDRLGPENYATVVEASLVASPGTTARNVHAVRQLVGRLAQWALCFGTGPRWRIDQASAVVSVWMGEFGYPVRQASQLPPGRVRFMQ